MRRQTLVGGERYITPEMKEYESQVLSAQERINELEASLFRQVCGQVAESASRVMAAARFVAHVDVFGSLAEVASRNGYVRPLLDEGDTIQIKAGRHPVVERMLPSASFVPNDTYLSSGDEQVVILTGPNMSGKSTYIRQGAVIVLMAQVGSFVPAESASIGLVDRIFTRVGLQDDLSLGQSTFMVEMLETASILNHATRRSLIILDEIGRGTSTYDGLAIARAVAEYIHNHPRLGCKTLFATHYHELTRLADSLPRVRNHKVAVSEERDEVVFLRRIVPGGADKSYGVHVARLAGLPGSVVSRAWEVLRELEDGSRGVPVGGSSRRRTTPPREQMSLFPGGPGRHRRARQARRRVHDAAGGYQQALRAAREEPELLGAHSQLPPPSVERGSRNRVSLNSYLRLVIVLLLGYSMSRPASDWRQLPIPLISRRRRMTTQDVTLPLAARLIIDGEVSGSGSGRQFPRENPANIEETVTLAEEGTLEDIRAAVDVARDVFDTDRDSWVSDYKLRERVLYQTAQLMRANGDRLAKVVSLEVGMPMRQAIPHVGAAADVFEFYAGYCSKLYGESMILPNGSIINLLKEPVGVVGLITPWNFPLTQTARKVAPALAVGCTMVAKPASYTPAATYELIKLLHEAGVPAGVVNCVPGPGRVVGNELVENSGIDKISFTGETGTGKNILQRAAVDLKRVSLELGGKKPLRNVRGRRRRGRRSEPRLRDVPQRRSGVRLHGAPLGAGGDTRPVLGARDGADPGPARGGSVDPGHRHGADDLQLSGGYGAGVHRVRAGRGVRPGNGRQQDTGSGA